VQRCFTERISFPVLAGWCWLIRGLSFDRNGLTRTYMPVLSRLVWLIGISDVSFIEIYFSKGLLLLILVDTTNCVRCPCNVIHDSVTVTLVSALLTIIRIIKICVTIWQAMHDSMCKDNSRIGCTFWQRFCYQTFTNFFIYFPRFWRFFLSERLFLSWLLLQQW